MRRGIMRGLSILLAVVWSNLGFGQSTEYLDSISNGVSDLVAEDNFDAAQANATLLIESSNTLYQGKGYHWMGIILGQMNDYQSSIEAYYNALNKYEEVQDTLRIGSVYSDIGIIYYEVRDRKRGKALMLKSIKHYEQNYHPKFDLHIATSYLNIGSVHTSLFGEKKGAEHADSAKYYFEKAKEYVERSGEPNDPALRSIDMNLTMLQALQTDSAFLSTFDRVYPMFMGAADSSTRSMLCSGKAHYFNGLEDYEQALQWSDSSLALFPAAGMQEFLMDYYSLRSDLLKALGKSDEAMLYMEKFTALDRKLHNPEVIGDLNEYGFEDEKEGILERSYERLEEVQTGHDQNIGAFMFALIGILLALVISLVWILRVRKKRNLLAQELNLSEQQRQSLREELHGYKEDLSKHVERLKEAERNKGTSDEKPKSSYNIIIDEIVNEVSSERSLQSLLDKSENIDGSFLIKLKEDYPSLSKSEIRLCVYLLMGMTSKDIAVVVNIEPASVDRRRYRLRKKLGLAKSDSLTDFLEGVERLVLQG